MNYAKIKRVLSAVIAALLCFVTVSSVPASAKSNDAVWQEIKAMSGAKYNSTYIKLMEKYSAKDAKNTIAYSKSRTKKFMDKFLKAAHKDKPQFKLNIINKDYLVSAAVKGDKFRAVGYIEGDGLAYYYDSENITLFNINTKEKCFCPMNEALENGFAIADTNEFAEAAESESIFDFFILDNEKGKVFKIKSGEKIYYYEEFESERYTNKGIFGFLFSENGNILAVINSEGSFCVSFSQKVDDSAFDIPEKDFNVVKYDSIYWL